MIARPAVAAAGAARAAVALAATLIALAAAAQPPDLGASRARWKAAALASYEYGYRKYCECHPESPPETVVTVRNGAVVGVRHRPVDSVQEVPAEARNFRYYWTIDDLFDLLRAAFERDAAVRASYDASLGYPTELHIDYDLSFIGDEVDLELTRVTAISP